MIEREIIKGLYSQESYDVVLQLLHKQLSNFFIISELEFQHINNYNIEALSRLEICISNVDNKYYKKNNLPFFSPYHSGQYLTFLYFLSNTCYKKGEVQLSEKIYYLNKIMHSCDIYPAVDLPPVFFLEHPVGTVLGRASYGNNFFAMQGCTVGGNKNLYPTIGSNVKMYSNSKILGDSIIGNNVVLAANTYIKDFNVPDNKVVFGQYPNLIVKDLI